MRKLTTSQILDWKRRRREARPVSDSIALVENLEVAWETWTDTNVYLAEFIPLRLVTIIEVSVREMVRELIDYGAPFSGKAGQLVNNAKLDLAFVEYLDGDRLTIGDFVAHSISINGIEQVLATLTNLVDNFPEKLATSFPRWKEEQQDWPLSPIISNYDQAMAGLKRLFEVRHVLAHEVPRDPVVNVDEVSDYLSATRQFIEACDWVAVECVRGSLPKTQVMMNLEAAEELETLIAEMNGKLAAVKGLPGIDAAKVDLAHQAWEGFADTEAALVASNMEGGSAYPMLFAAAKAELVEDRIEQLQRTLEGWMS